ncbi:MAG: hypothetical protein IE931_05730 [Sphingobacteriales bacterium]|nr:hypothetical protein [Sphingobacteriales bacterium]
MRIPTKTDILISGVNFTSLIFAALLCKNGLKVLVVDERKGLEKFNPQLQIDAYNLIMLKEIGYSFDDSTNQISGESLIRQTLTLLATHLSSVIWDVKTELKNSQPPVYELLNNDKSSLNESLYYFSGAYLNEQPDFNLNLRNIFLKGWRIIGTIQKKLDGAVLSSSKQEFEILIKQNKSKSKIENWLQKIHQKQIKPTPNLIESKLNLHLSQERKVEAGELLPDLKVYDEKTKQNTQLYQWCGYHQFSLIILGDLLQVNLFTIARWIQLHYPIQLYYLPHTERNQSIFDYFKIRKGEKKTLIVRPDRFIGLLHDAIDIDTIDNYLQNFILMLRKDKKLI